MNVINISAKAEWSVVRERYGEFQAKKSPYGEYIVIENDSQLSDFILFHGGWAKINAAGSTQFVINKFKPKLVINIGTCGGVEGKIATGNVILAEKTIVYDIYEKMFNPIEAISEFSTNLDLSWLSEPYPIEVKRKLLISGDTDLDPKHISELFLTYGAIAGDWESGAIAHICKINNVFCLILRGVTDIVSSNNGEAYNEPQIFINRTRTVMNYLLDSLTDWLDMFNSNTLYNNAMHTEVDFATLQSHQ